MRRVPGITPMRIISIILLLLLVGLALWMKLREADERYPRPPATPVSSIERVEYQAVDFSTISGWTSNTDGREIAIAGRLHICDGSEEWLPRGLDNSVGTPVLYRFVITCCPGHAVPAGIGVQDPTGILAHYSGQDDWVLLEGAYIAADPEAPGTVGAIELRNWSPLEEAPQPAAEQLFPPSKMGAPCQGSRPDIPYPPQ